LYANGNDLVEIDNVRRERERETKTERDRKTETDRKREILGLLSLGTWTGGGFRPSMQKSFIPLNITYRKRFFLIPSVI
jgi:hypothetical protein